MISKLIVDEQGYGYAICRHNWGMKNEVASFHRFYYVLGGKAHYRSAKEDTDLLANNLYILPTFTPYTLWHDPKDPLEVIYFHLEITPDITDDILQIPIVQNGLEMSLLSTMRWFGDLKDIQSLEDLCGILVKYIAAKYRPAITSDPRLTRVIHYIDQHIQENITVGEMARIACLERAYFSRFFKRQYKISPMRFVTQKKISLAAKAILSGLAFSDVSQMVSYEDEKVFSRVFKKIYGCSPTKFRKSHNLQP